MVNIYIEKGLPKKAIIFTFQELFRYINRDIAFINSIDKADIVYATSHKETCTKLYIQPAIQLWKNYKKSNSLPMKPLIKEKDITFLYPNDLIASTFFLLSGYEEYINQKRDKYNRFLYAHSKYNDEKIYDEPLVEKYRDLLIQSLNEVGINSKKRVPWSNASCAFFLSHDVDGVYKYRNSLLSLLKILLKPSKFTFREYIKSKKNTLNDPYFRGFSYFISQSKKHQFKSTFFFISKVRQKLDNFYDIHDKAIRQIQKKILDEGFEIGLHGSLSSSSSQVYLQEEKHLLNQKKLGLRQHYLMYNILKTPSIHNKSVVYDSTLGFADNIGFRRGTCFPFKIFEIHTDSMLDTWELPLNVMEVTLKGYLGLTPSVAFEKVMEVIQKIEEHQGVFTLLWHPGNTSDEWSEWIEKVYEPTLKYLNAQRVRSYTGLELVTCLETL